MGQTKELGANELVVVTELAGSLWQRLVRGERGGPALLFLITFLAMAIPIATGALHTSAQLAQNSRVYDTKLSGDYDAASGIEVAMHEVLGDPTFGDGLIPSSPDKSITVDVNGQTTSVVATKVFPTVALTGQGLSVSKTVTPSTAAVGVETSFTYTITLKNEGTDTIKVESILDFLPPHFTYDDNTGGLTSADPEEDDSGSPVSCGGTPYRLGRLPPEPPRVSGGVGALALASKTALSGTSRRFRDSPCSHSQTRSLNRSSERLEP